ncbi:adenylate kinase [Suicoccus acidiformans]|uniref:Adenylate kinase n=1 Tax=Suicoccus acidiformans TaxID=2036206 RepID=A0A347WN40_9LACT|nr:adenylate kinase [Suicoccus acidiformans]AXY26497.1 adenylate kinase [Suicoccus acidiformans]
MNILLMGLPGAGKGTQSEMIANDYDMIHISTGDIFRKAIKDETPLGLEAKRYTDNGDLVPDDITNGLVKERLAEADVQANGFLLDGYPRTIAQAEALDANLADIDSNLDHVIYIEVDADILKERLSGRIMCSNCGATYHKVYNPPKVSGVCDVCGHTEFHQREDDTPEKVGHRIQLQMDSIRPILEHYEAANLLTKINGDQAIETVYREIRNILGE